jgi:hypothetical protein
MKITAFKSIFVTNILKTEVKRQTFLGQRYKLPGLCQYHLTVTSMDFPFQQVQELHFTHNFNFASSAAVM